MNNKGFEVQVRLQENDGKVNMRLNANFNHTKNKIVYLMKFRNQNLIKNWKDNRWDRHLYIKASAFTEAKMTWTNM